jgi:hypothetical protein
MTAERGAMTAQPDTDTGREDWVPYTFQSGDRVQVRVSLECRYCLDPRFQRCYERALADDGRTATVYDVGHDWCSCRYDDETPDAAHLAHTVWVTWDDRRPYDDPEWTGVPFDAHFAPSELIPLTERGALVAGGRP